MYPPRGSDPRGRWQKWLGAENYSVRDAVGDAVRDAVGDAVGAENSSVRDAVGDAVRDAVGGRSDLLLGRKILASAMPSAVIVICCSGGKF